MNWSAIVYPWILGFFRVGLMTRGEIVSIINVPWNTPRRRNYSTFFLVSSVVVHWCVQFDVLGRLNRSITGRFDLDWIIMWKMLDWSRSLPGFLVGPTVYISSFCRIFCWTFREFDHVGMRMFEEQGLHEQFDSSSASPFMQEP